MRCLRPTGLAFAGYRANGKPRFKFVPDPSAIGDHPESKRNRCGKCEACVITKGEELATRIACEARLHPVGWFTTNTYADHCLPSDRKVSLAHAAHWRKCVQSVDPAAVVLVVGEYGDHTNRPHYHSVTFANLDGVIRNIGTNEEPIYWSDRLREAWGFGNIELSMLNPSRVNYIGNHFIKSYGRDDTVVSYPRNPAIGDNFRRKYWDDIARLGVIHWEGQAFRVPAAWYAATSDDRYAIVRARHQEVALEREAALIAQGTDPDSAAKAALMNRMSRLGLRTRKL